MFLSYVLLSQATFHRTVIVWQDLSSHGWSHMAYTDNSTYTHFYPLGIVSLSRFKGHWSTEQF